MHLRTKLFITIICLATIPLLLGMLFSHLTLSRMDKDFQQSSKTTINKIIASNKELLKQVAADVVREKAHSVAKQVEIYMKSHNKTLAELQRDPTFKAIAVQPVGKTGYTALTEYPAGICRFHKKKEIVDLDLHSLADKLPEFWRIMAKSLSGAESYGFYTWKEPNIGKLREKYMHIIPINATTADGKRMSVAATAYVDEFYEQINQIENDSQTKLNGLMNIMDQTFAELSTVLIIIFVITLIAAITTSIIIAKMLTTPLKRLTLALNKLKQGDFNITLPHTTTNEFEELSDALRRMSKEIKLRDALLNTLLKTLRGKYGKLAAILMRKDVQSLIKKIPQVKKLLPRNILRALKKP